MGLLEQHADKWEPEPMSGCYLWTGSVKSRDDRYFAPVIRVTRPLGKRRRKFEKPKELLFPRQVLIEKSGPCPDGHATSHICGNCYCVNPDHLVWETSLQNNRRIPKDKRRRKAARGCYFHKQSNKWVAHFYANGKTRHFGSYDTEQAAHAVYLSYIEKET